MRNVLQLLKSPVFLLKILELVFSSLAVGLVAGQCASYECNKLAVVYGTLVGFIMISVLVIVSDVMEQPIHQFLLMGIGLAGGVLFLVSGGIMIETYSSNNSHYTRSVLGSGIVGLINGIVYFVDVAFLFTSLRSSPST